MKWFKRISLGLLAVIVIVAGGGILFIRLALPKDIPVHAISVPKGDTALIARGKYLTHNITPCFVCHTPRDHHKFSEPILEDSLGAGKWGFGKVEKFPGQLYFQNLTPYNLGSWSDGELYRVLTSGIKKNGEPVFPIMPYEAIGQMDSMDVISIIAYLRTLRPIEKGSQDSQVDFPLNLIMRTLPQKPAHIPLASIKTMEDKGHYLASIGGCKICHTPVDDRSQIIEHLAFSGGREFILGNGSRITSSNITASTEYGIGLWSEDAFVNRFKSYADAASLPHLGPTERNTSMPWTAYAQMKDEDLRAIYRYLKTLQPIENRDEGQFTPPHGATARL